MQQHNIAVALPLNQTLAIKLPGTVHSGFLGAGKTRYILG
jgi:hypothetical protein